jgi:hypothetical protein
MKYTNARLIMLVSPTFLLAALLISCAGAPKKHTGPPFKDLIDANAQQMFDDGKKIFRFDTFGDEDFWGGKLHLHEPIAGEKHGGTGPGLTPKQALELGLKVDTDQLPAAVVALLKAKKVDFDDSKYTMLLLKHDAVVGVKAFMDKDGKVTSVGITCGLCHSSVDDAIQPGVGRRLDGWPNRDLNVGAIIALSPNLKPMSDMLGVDTGSLKKVLMGWGPGKFDAEVALDGKGARPDGKTAAVLIPPAFGLAGVNNHTWTGGWGTVTYWNAFVANLEMHGKGTFFDPRLDNADQYPVSARNKSGDKRDNPDMITAKLGPLHYYQLSLPAPVPPSGSFNSQLASSGKQIFEGKARCATCHVPPLFTEPGWNVHKPTEIGIDDFQANRAPGRSYRTAPLRGLFAHTKGGFYHDGRFATLNDVVNHYNNHLNLGLSGEEKAELVEYLKSL